MRLSIIIFCIYSIIFYFLISSCTFRHYEVYFNYYVGNNRYAEKITDKDVELIKRSITDIEKQVTNIPPGSGNLTIYIQAEVPKHIQTDANLDASVPLVGK